jgi:hypothetical protein
MRFSEKNPTQQFEASSRKYGQDSEYNTILNSNREIEEHGLRHGGGYNVNHRATIKIL